MHNRHLRSAGQRQTVGPPDHLKQAVQLSPRWPNPTLTRTGPARGWVVIDLWISARGRRVPILPIGRTTATGPGVPIRGELRVRILPTWDGDKSVKLAAPGHDEGPFSLANELLGAGIAERLGLWQPQRWVVEVPARIAAVAGWAPKLRHRLGAGVDVDEAFKLELDNEPVLAGVRQHATGESVLATLVLLDWLRLGDHEAHNFVTKDGQIIPVDFASAPAEQVWRSGSVPARLSNDPGGLRGERGRVSQEESNAIRKRFDLIGTTTLERIVRGIPQEMTDGLQGNVVSVLLDTKQEVRDAYWP
jgi:hypothetical protein